MIEYHYEMDFALDDEVEFSEWINRVVRSEKGRLGAVSYIFCGDNYLLKLNQEYLDHDTLTDIITFDYSSDAEISGDIFISYERVLDNASRYNVSEDEELKRVMAHGVLHMLGYNDKTEEGRLEMRRKESEKMKMFHVEHRKK